MQCLLVSCLVTKPHCLPLELAVMNHPQSADTYGKKHERMSEPSQRYFTLLKFLTWSFSFRNDFSMIIQLALDSWNGIGITLVSLSLRVSYN